MTIQNKPGQDLPDNVASHEEKLVLPHVRAEHHLLSLWVEPSYDLQEVHLGRAARKDEPLVTLVYRKPGEYGTKGKKSMSERSQSLIFRIRVTAISDTHIGGCDVKVGIG